MFHAIDGWFFERTVEDGVRMIHRKGGKADGEIDAIGTFDDGTWCSIVASVSEGGEGKGRWYSAMDFHHGKTGDREGFA